MTKQGPDLAKQGGGRRGTRTPDILLVSQMREAVPYSPTLTPTGSSSWMFMALQGRFECSGDTTGASLGVRIAGAERHPFRDLAPLAGVRGLAPDVQNPTSVRLVEGWRAYAATAAPALVISRRTGLGWRCARLLDSSELVADENHDQDECDRQASKEGGCDDEAEQPFGHGWQQWRCLVHGRNGSGSVRSRLR